MNDNQNHRIRDGWTSSRVIAPPGGGGSLTLGLAPAPRKVESVPAKENTQPKEETQEEKEKPQVQTTTSTTPTPPPSQHPTPTPASTPVSSSSSSAVPLLPGLVSSAQPVSANAFASGANMNGAQVMTGRPTSRVRYAGGTGGKDSGWTLG